MKKLSIKNIKIELDNCNADDTTKELVFVNVNLVNDLISEYSNDSKANAYLIYQLTLQIFKMLNELKKLNQKLNNDYNYNDDDNFNEIVKSIKNNKIETRKI